MNEDVEIREDEARRDDEDVRDVARDMARERRASQADRPTTQAERVDERRDEAKRVPERDATPAANAEPARESLFAPERASQLKSRWSDVQARFVDDPREAVKAADGLVDEVIKDLSKQFADERSGLESQWGRDEKVSTEDLRVALRRYRSFFERLLSV